MTLSSLSFVVFLDPYQGSNGVCLLSKYVVLLVWGIVTLPSLSPYSNKVLISRAHRWETANTYLQDIYSIVKPWIQKNKSISQIKMCMCGEWMVYGDDGDNNGESLILLLLFWGDTYLPCSFETFGENEMLCIFFFFPLRWVSCTPNSTIGHLSIFTSRLTFYFFRGSGHLPLFISSYTFFSLFFRALISWNNIASGSNQDNLSIYFTGKNRNRRIFLAILSWIRSRIFLGGSGDGNGWIYVDAYFRSRSSMCEACVNVQVDLDLTTWQAPKGLHSLTILNAHKQ